jgi:hypothetical protein
MSGDGRRDGDAYRHGGRDGEGGEGSRRRRFDCESSNDGGSLMYGCRRDGAFIRSVGRGGEGGEGSKRRRSDFDGSSEGGSDRLIAALSAQTYALAEQTAILRRMDANIARLAQGRIEQHCAGRHVPEQHRNQTSRAPEAITGTWTFVAGASSGEAAGGR